jgi:hypothetical protein
VPVTARLAVVLAVAAVVLVAAPCLPDRDQIPSVSYPAMSRPSCLGSLLYQQETGMYQSATDAPFSVEIPTAMRWEQTRRTWHHVFVLFLFFFFFFFSKKIFNPAEDDLEVERLGYTQQATMTGPIHALRGFRIDAVVLLRGEGEGKKKRDSKPEIRLRQGISSNGHFHSWRPADGKRCRCCEDERLDYLGHVAQLRAGFKFGIGLPCGVSF